MREVPGSGRGRGGTGLRAVGPAGGGAGAVGPAASGAAGGLRREAAAGAVSRVPGPVFERPDRRCAGRRADT
ncbi:hypothetical protein GCM10009564_17150 [Streptomyces thermogriseus]|uniref:Uncharacterized protein n=1 Tax=Streptomyces thermogriseus TaxID=75292 RepID=A0ABN1SWS2_9ACTN